MGQSFFQLLWISGIQLLYLVGIFIAIGFVLGYLEKYSNRYLLATYGRKGVLLTAFVGTPIHELSHAFFCLVFGHKIKNIKLLQLNDPNGVLGYVQHEYNPKSIYQRIGKFFIGLAPVFGGIFALSFSMYLLVPQAYDAFKGYLESEVKAGQINWDTIQIIFGACWALWKSLFSVSNFINPAFWLFLILAISISSHIALSRADMKESAEGFVLIFALLVVFNLVAGMFGMNSQDIVVSFTTYNAIVLAFSSIAMFFSIITLGISFLLYQIQLKR